MLPKFGTWHLWTPSAVSRVARIAGMSSSAVGAQIKRSARWCHHCGRTIFVQLALIASSFGAFHLRCRSEPASVARRTVQAPYIRTRELANHVCSCMCQVGGMVVTASACLWQCSQAYYSMVHVNCVAPSARAADSCQWSLSLMHRCVMSPLHTPEGHVPVQRERHHLLHHMYHHWWALGGRGRLVGLWPLTASLLTLV
jgi:hypothetical protein